MEAFSEDGNDDVGGNGDPDLRLHRIFGCSIEGLYSEMLLDPLEEQLDLPPTFVEIGDGECRKDKIVGHKNERFFFFDVEVFYTA